MDALWEFWQCIQQLSHIVGRSQYPDAKRFGCILLPLILVVQLHESFMNELARHAKGSVYRQVHPQARK